MLFLFVHERIDECELSALITERRQSEDFEDECRLLLDGMARCHIWGIREDHRRQTENDRQSLAVCRKRGALSTFS